MTFNPLPFNVMAFGFGRQGLPQVLIFYGLLGLGLPATLLPAREPFGNPPAQILRVGEENNLMGTIKHRKCFQHSPQFHLIV